MKRRIHKLFAVATFVSAASASAIAAPPAPATRAPESSTVSSDEARTKRLEHDLRVARQQLAVALAEESAAAAAMKAEPRVLANGAPACGNTLAKVQKECTVERSDQVWKQRVQRLVQAGVAVRAKQARAAKLATALARRGGDPTTIVVASAENP